LANLLPINLAHRTMSDANILNKFNLKKGTPIVPQICCVLFDEKAQRILLKFLCKNLRYFHVLIDLSLNDF